MAKTVSVETLGEPERTHAILAGEAPMASVRWLSRLRLLPSLEQTVLARVVASAPPECRPGLWRETIARLERGLATYGPMTLSRLRELDYEAEIRAEELDILVYSAMRDVARG